MAALGPMEEFGWRGVALPLLQRRFRPIAADLILSTLWALWHLPAFFLSGTPQSQWSFPAFFIGVVSISFILTPTGRTGRSRPCPAVKPNDPGSPRRRSTNPTCRYSTNLPRSTDLSVD